MGMVTRGCAGSERSLRCAHHPNTGLQRTRPVNVEILLKVISVVKIYVLVLPSEWLSQGEAVGSCFHGQTHVYSELCAEPFIGDGSPRARAYTP